MPKPAIIIHFQALELYPPVQNLINYINSNYKQHPVIVISTHCNNKSIKKFEINSDHVTITRLGKSGFTSSAVSRYFSYLYFYLSSFLILLTRRPSVILYFETLSSYPAYLYKKYIAKKVALFIHYHEYTSPSEYISGMKMVAFFHKKERSLFKQASWISHTNQDRMDRFLADENIKSADNTFLFPNYPPLSWHKPPKPAGDTLRIVYAGALSMDTMYTEDFARWVQSQQGKWIWDIYSHNFTPDAKIFFENLGSSHINLMNGVTYDELSEILPKYDIGVILYNGHIPNYIFNAPNKLFEYLACGLNVWFPDVMKGSMPYVSPNTFPKIVALDFLNLEKYDKNSLLGNENDAHKEVESFCEKIFPELTERFFNYAS